MMALLPNIGGGYSAALQAQNQPNVPGAVAPAGAAPGAGNYNIAGSLPFGASGANFDFSGNPASLGANYAASYKDALNLNSANYNNILSGYQQTAQNQVQGQQGIMGTIANYGQGARQDISDRTVAAQGQATQGLINRGLGNTTVQDSVTRGINYDQGKLNLSLDDQIAQMKAGYQNQALMQNTGLAGQQLGFMNSVMAPYPNAALYGQLGQQWGAAQQGAANRTQAADQFKQLLGASGGGPMAQAGPASAGGVTRGAPAATNPGMFAGNGQMPTGYPGGQAPGAGYGYTGSAGLDYLGGGAGGGGVDYLDGTWDLGGGGAYGAGGDWGSGDAVMAATGFPSGTFDGGSGGYADYNPYSWADDGSLTW